MRSIGVALVFLVTAAACMAQQFVISTAAGGAPPPTPVGALGASVGAPQGVATDFAGNIYFSSNALNSVFKLDANGVMTRVAGNGRPGYSGDSGPATSAELNNPRGLALDGAGNLYIADSGNYRVRKVAASTGIITTVAGTGGCCYSGDGGPATSAELDYPEGVAVDASGNLYIADWGSNRIRKVSPADIITTIAGNGNYPYAGDGGPATSAQFDPYAVAVDAAGNLYIADRSNNRIREVAASSGIITTVAGTGSAGYSGDGGSATSAQLGDPYGVAVDGSGDLYIADWLNNRIREVSFAGIITTVAGNGNLTYAGDGGPAKSAQFNPYAVAVDGSGNLYIADGSNNRIRKVAASNSIITTAAGSGSYSYSGDGGPGGSALLGRPSGLAMDGVGNVYIADTYNNVVRKISPAGVITTVAGDGVSGYSGDGASATSAQLNRPYGVALDRSGNLYIADTNNHRIRKVSSIGNISTVAGSGVAGYSGDSGSALSARLDYPYGVAVDPSGNVYIADTDNHRIRMVSPAGNITTVAGNGTGGYSGDGGPATSVELDYPKGVAVDGSGSLYIADTSNNRIRKVSPAGNITTAAGNGTGGYAGDGGPATSAELNYPEGVAMDASGNLYIADTDNESTRKVSSAGIITTIAGNGTGGYSGDGSSSEDLSATSAQLDFPSGVAVDSSGDVYVTDTVNNAVRLLMPANTAAPLPDLYITSLTGSTTATAGGQVSMGITVSNQGAAASGAFTVKFYLSPTTTITTVSVDTGWFCNLAGLAAGASESCTGPVGIPATLAAGAWYLGAIADPSGQILESNKNNNTRVADSGPITVMGLLKIVTTSPLSPGTPGVAYSQTLTASGGVSPYSWSVTSGTLPAGLALASGAISGTPATAGAYSFTVQVKDSAGTTATGTFALTISVPLSIATSSPLLSGWAGGSYSQPLVAAGGVPPYAWTVLSGSLPSGLTLSSAGLISGTPAAAGSFAFTAQVADSASAKVAKAFALIVIAGASGGALPRAGVLGHIAVGGTWDSDIWLVNNASTAVPVRLAFRGDDGSVGFKDSNWNPVTVPLSVSLQGVVLSATPTTIDAVISGNSAMVITTSSASASWNAEGWADVLSTGTGLSGFCVFRSTSLGEGIAQLQTQTAPATLILPFDNTTNQYTTGVAIGNIGGAASVTATVWDVNGNSILTAVPLTYHSGDATHSATTWPANGHDAFMLNSELPATASIRGTIQFKVGSGGALTGVGLLVGLGQSTFTSVPVVLQ
jgi:sugar lactone lactonase YvrE